jgi:hypothetical protein
MPVTPAFPDCQKYWHSGNAIMSEIHAWQTGMPMIGLVEEGI